MIKWGLLIEPAFRDCFKMIKKPFQLTKGQSKTDNRDLCSQQKEPQHKPDHLKYTSRKQGMCHHYNK